MFCNLKKLISPRKSRVRVTGCLCGILSLHIAFAEQIVVQESFTSIVREKDSVAQHSVDKKISADFQDDAIALMNASAIGDAEEVKALLADEEIDPNLRDNRGMTALMRASVVGHLGVVKALLSDKRVDPNLQDNDGMTSLVLASSAGHLDIVKALVADERISPNLQDNGSREALIVAVVRGHLEIVKVLLDSNKVKMDMQDYAGRIVG